jgi:protein phosphatase
MSVELRIPAFALVPLTGATGSGKTTFARKHFAPTEVLSSDELRAAITDDPNEQGATHGAFEILHLIAARRLARMKLMVIDATNVEQLARKPLIERARRYYAQRVAGVLDVPLKTLKQRGSARLDRSVPAQRIAWQQRELQAPLLDLGREGFASVHLLRS